MTTNLAFSGWPTIFPNATCATALIDRTVYHADVIAIEGDSYRRRDADPTRRSAAPRGLPHERRESHRIPTQTDIAISPELAILAALRVSIELAGETLRVVHPVDDGTLLFRR